jgi:hypothetical protein
MEKQQCWHFTITFKGTITASRKFKMIEKIPAIINNNINDKVNKNIIIDYCIEYHKRSKTDRTNNPCAPHVHGVLHCTRLTQGTAEEILKQFNKEYGRTQFFLQEDDVSQRKWLEYCRKDVEKNNKEYSPYEHCRQVIFTYPRTVDNSYLKIQSDEIIEDII